MAGVPGPATAQQTPAIGAAPGVPAPVDTLAPDAEDRWVPFAFTPGNQIVFTLSVNGTAVAALLDTGVSHSLVSRTLVDRLGLAVRKGGQADAIGGALAIGWADVARIEMGGLVRQGGRLAVATLPAGIGGQKAGDAARPIELFVGRDMTAGYALDIDYAARRFRLLPSGRLPFRGATVPLSIAPGRQLYVSEVLLNGRRLRPLIVDTGDGHTITLSRAAWEATGIIPAARTSTISFGLGGAIETDLVVLPEIEAGELTAREVPVYIERPGGFSDATGMAGRIGSGFLQGYRVLLDPGAGRMVLSPQAEASALPVRSTSGLLVTAEGDRLRVLHVMRGSPAERDGWRSGEMICMVDSTPIPPDYAASELAGWTVGNTGRVVALDLCDGSRRLLTLRRFY